MSALSEALGTAAPPHQIEHRGKVYQVSLVNQNVKVAFERRHFERWKKALTLLRDEYGTGYVLALDHLGEKYARGDFELLTDTGLAFLGTPAGVQCLLALLTGLPEEEILPLVVEKLDEVKALVAMILEESFPSLVKKAKAPDGETVPPNPQAPATAN